MELRPGRCVFCTNLSCTFVISPFSLLPFHMHHSLVQALYRVIGISEFAQISVHGPIRLCRRRNILEARPGRCTFWIDPSCTFVGSPSSLLSFHMHHSLVQALYRAIDISEFAQISIHGPIRRCKRRSSLEARLGRCAFCTYSRFTFLDSSSP